MVGVVPVTQASLSPDKRVIVTHTMRAPRLATGLRLLDQLLTQIGDGVISGAQTVPCFSNSHDHHKFMRPDLAS